MAIEKGTTSAAEEYRAVADIAALKKQYGTDFPSINQLQKIYNEDNVYGFGAGVYFNTWLVGYKKRFQVSTRSKISGDGNNQPQLGYGGSSVLDAYTYTTKRKNRGRDSVAKMADTSQRAPAPIAPTPEYSNPSEWKWNLPPHKWSLPLVQRLGDEKNFSFGQDNEKYRRGRIWWKASDPSIDLVTGSANTKVIRDKNAERRFGFQFLWNPEAFGTTVSVSMDVTPTAQDRFLGGAGFFPATEGITFNIRLDRTNDFACAAARFNRPTNSINVSNIGAPVASYITTDQVRGLEEFYKHGIASLSDSARGLSIEDKLVDLFTRGTIADLEFLYRAINGIGPSGSLGDQWINARGIATADIGFLQPTLLNIDIGPLSFNGYVNNLAVTHIAFTPDMVPIRTDVTISLQLLSTAGLTTASTGFVASEDYRRGLNR
jgi:hypothetical protein